MRLKPLQTIHLFAFEYFKSCFLWGKKIVFFDTLQIPFQKPGFLYIYFFIFYLAIFFIIIL